MLYEALTGSVPFDGGYLEIMQQKQQVDPPPPSQVVSGVPPTSTSCAGACSIAIRARGRRGWR